MLKKIALCMLAGLLVFGTAGCKPADKTPKIGVSFGVGAAARWPKEQGYMEEHAKELGADIEVRMNKTDEPKTQAEDCKELVDSGIDVLVLIPRNVNDAGEIIEYAHKKNVKVISYARAVLGDSVDLFVGYDSTKIGQMMGQYLAETVYEGDYIILQGDKGDYNAQLLYEGAMRYISPMEGDINILLDEPVPGWDAATAKEMVKSAVAANGNKINAILAPNDALAGSCAEALRELGVTEHVVITGMDAELAAAKRIVKGEQDCTIYMDLRELSNTAIEEACHMARNEEINVNADFDNGSDSTVKANLIVGKLVTKQNLDKILIDSGELAREEVYAE